MQQDDAINRKCQLVYQSITYAIQKARSITREIRSGYGTSKADPELIEEICRDSEPWLFGPECEKFLIQISEQENVSPVDVLNTFMYLTMRRKDRFEQECPGDSRALEIVSFRFGQFRPFWENPMKALDLAKV